MAPTPALECQLWLTAGLSLSRRRRWTKRRVMSSDYAKHPSSSASALGPNDFVRRQDGIIAIFGPISSDDDGCRGLCLRHDVHFPGCEEETSTICTSKLEHFKITCPAKLATCWNRTNVYTLHPDPWHEIRGIVISSTSGVSPRVRPRMFFGVI